MRRNRVFFFVAYDGYRDRRQTESRLVSIPTAREAQRRLQRAAGAKSSTPATTRPNPNGTGFIRDPFPGNIIPADRISSISRNLQSYLPEPTNAGLQNNYLGGSLPIGFNNDNVTSKVDREPVDAAPAVGALRARLTPPAHAVSRRHERADGAAAALHGDTAGRGDADDGADQAHVRDQPAMAESGQRRLRAPRRADRQRDDRRPLPNRGRIARLAGRRGGFGVPETRFAGPNPPTPWRGTDARAFTEFLNNYTMQNNLQSTLGRHAITFGFQGQRLEAEERERTYGSLATFGFSNVQTAGFGATGTLNAATGNAYASFLLGELNATTVIEDSQVATTRALHQLRLLGAGRLKVTPGSVAQSRPALRHHEAVHRALRSVVVPESRSAEPGRGRLRRRDYSLPATDRTAADAGRRSRPTTATSVRASGWRTA